MEAPPSDIAAVDINGDGHQDLLIAFLNLGGLNTPAAVVMALGNGTGSFQTASTTQVGNFNAPISLQTADFNNDEW